MSAGKILSRFTKKSSNPQQDSTSPVDIVTAVGDPHTVTNIILEKKGITDKDVEVLARLLQAADPPSSLQRLNLSGNNITASAAPYLVSLLLSLPNLRELDLSRNKLAGSKAIKPLADVLETHKSLKTLNLAGNDLGPTGLEIVGAIFRKSSTLTCIELGWKRFTKTEDGTLDSMDRVAEGGRYKG